MRPETPNPKRKPYPNPKSPYPTLPYLTPTLPYYPTLPEQPL